MLRKAIKKSAPRGGACPRALLPFIAIFGLSLTFSVSSVSAENSSSLLLAKIHKAYTTSPSYTSTFVQIYAPAGFAATSPETGRLTLQAPDQVRFDYDGADGKVFTFDGKAARQYVAADRQMVVRTLGPEDRARLRFCFSSRLIPSASASTPPRIR